jgi:hypothetical protein
VHAELWAVKGVEYLAKDDLCAVDILRLAQAHYDKNRADLKNRFHVEDSQLLYPASNEDRCGWIVVRYEGKMFAVAGCADKMYGARFLFSFTNESDGRWTCTGIYGSEYFKGE